MKGRSYFSSTSVDWAISSSIGKGLIVGSDSQQQSDDNTKAEARKDRKMLSLEDVEKLVRQEVEAYNKQFEKLNDPVERQRRFDRIIERLEREGLDEPEEESEWDEAEDEDD